MYKYIYIYNIYIFIYIYIIYIYIYIYLYTYIHLKTLVYKPFKNSCIKHETLSSIQEFFMIIYHLIVVIDLVHLERYFRHLELM